LSDVGVPGGLTPTMTAGVGSERFVEEDTMAQRGADPGAVDIHVDPSCPWAWLTWNWLQQVAALRPITVTTRLFSLAEVNRDREKDERAQAAHEAGERALRCLVAAEREGGAPALTALYGSIGDAYHERGEPLGDEAVLRSCAAAAGLGPDLVARALADPATLTALAEAHRTAVDAGAFGVPTVQVEGGPAFFGPIIDRRMDPEAAAQLWDHVAWLLAQQPLFEIKRARRDRAQVGRYRLAGAARG
jgi:predicted DsbA family dithiol-disulfide isomerase